MRWTEVGSCGGTLILAAEGGSVVNQCVGRQGKLARIGVLFLDPRGGVCLLTDISTPVRESGDTILTQQYSGVRLQLIATDMYAGRK